MKLLLYFAMLYIILAILLLYRLFKGPSVVDRAVAGNSIDILISVALILVALYTGREIYLDVALVGAILGFLSNVLISKYLEGKL